MAISKFDKYIIGILEFGTLAVFGGILLDYNRPMKEISRAPIEVGTKVMHIIRKSSPWDIFTRTELYDGTNCVSKVNRQIDRNTMKYGNHIICSEYDWRPGSYQVFERQR